jgi:phage-related protein
MKFKDFIGNALNWIKKAIRAVWHIFKVIVKNTIKLITSFLHIIGDFIRTTLSEIRRGLKKVFVARTTKEISRP